MRDGIDAYSQSPGKHDVQVYHIIVHTRTQAQCNVQKVIEFALASDLKKSTRLPDNYILAMIELASTLSELLSSELALDTKYTCAVYAMPAYVLFLSICWLVDHDGMVPPHMAENERALVTTIGVWPIDLYRRPLAHMSKVKRSLAIHKAVGPYLLGHA
jgi:hypothetical protein